LDIGRAGKDPQEARRKGRPKRDRCAEQSMRELRLASVPEAGKKADELGYEDQRAGRRLGKAEPVEHLARAQPAIRFHRLLRHIGEHRIGAPNVTIASFEKNRAMSVVTWVRPSSTASRTSGTIQIASHTAAVRSVRDSETGESAS